MTGPDWPRRRYELIVKKGTTPLGLKLHQTKTRRGVYANGFADGAYAPPGPQACMRVGDILVSVEGKDVYTASLAAALAAIESARRRDRLRDFITAKQDDARKGNVVLVFERLSPRLSFRDVALDPRKVVYLLNFMLEVRRATSAKEEVSLDEARLMFWLEVQVLFEMSAVMTPSREDMAKVYDKFFRQGSGFFVHELAVRRKLKLKARKTWDGHMMSAALRGTTLRAGPDLSGEAKTPAEAAPTPAAMDSAGDWTSDGGKASASINGNASAMGASAERASLGAAGDDEATHPPRVKGSALRSYGSFEGGVHEWLSSSGAAGSGAATGSSNGGSNGSDLPADVLPGDLSKMFRASQEKVEETLTAGAFFRFKTSPWFGRMVAHLVNSPDFVHVPFEKVVAEQELRDVMMFHVMIGQVPGWLQVWREVELSVKPRLALLQTRRSVRHRPATPPAMIDASVQRSRRSTYPFAENRPLSNGDGGADSGGGSVNGGAAALGGGPLGSSVGAVPGTAEAKADAAIAIMASAVYLWDFFLSADAHASLGLSRDTAAYGTLREALTDESDGPMRGAELGDSPTSAAARVASPGEKDGDAAVDLAVAVGKALLDMQRQVLRKLCASIYPDFQASSTYEQLCEELTTRARPRRPSSAGIPPAARTDSPPSEKATRPTKLLADGSPPRSSGAADPKQRRSPRHSDPLITEASELLPPLMHPSVASLRASEPTQGNDTASPRPRSPFAFLGAAGSPAKQKRGHSRGSSAPGLDVAVEYARRDTWADAAVFRSSGGRVEGGEDHEPPAAASSGPAFDALWKASRGSVLEKVMRKIELPSHVSRHRPPLANLSEGGAEAGGARAGRRLLRSGSGCSLGSSSPELRQHLLLPHKARRFGRRPHPVHSSPDGHDVSAPWNAERQYRSTISEQQSAFGGGEDDDEPFPARRGVSVPGTVVAEWALSFSGQLEKGVTTIKTERAFGVATSGDEQEVAAGAAPPEGLEPFFWPELPANGEGPSVRSPGRRTMRTPQNAGGSNGAAADGTACECGDKTLAWPLPQQQQQQQPRIFAFAAPGRSGAGTFYGVCLSVFRPVRQWVGDATSPSRPAPEAASAAANASSSSSLSGTQSGPTVLPGTRVPEAAGAAVDNEVARAASTGSVPVVVSTLASPNAQAGLESERSLWSRVGSADHDANGQGLWASQMSSGGQAVAVELPPSVAAAGRTPQSSGASAEGTDAADKRAADGGVQVSGATSSVLDLSRFKRGMSLFSKSSLAYNKVSPSATANAAPSPRETPPETPLVVWGTVDTGCGDGHERDAGSTSDATAGLPQETGAAVTMAQVTPPLPPPIEVEGAIEGDSGGSNAVQSADNGLAADGETKQDEKRAAPLVLEMPSRFKMTMGIFGGSSKSSSSSFGQARRPSGGPGLLTAADAPSAIEPLTLPAAPAGSSKTPRGWSSSTPTAMSASSSGSRKFASYAKRAGHFIGSSESRGVGRSPKPTPPLSPDALANGPPPPSPGIPTYLASPPLGLAPRKTVSLFEDEEAEEATCGQNLPESVAVESGSGVVQSLRARSSAPMADSAAAPAAVHGVTSGNAGSSAAAAAATVGTVASTSDGVGASGMKGRSMSATTLSSGGSGGGLGSNRTELGVLNGSASAASVGVGAGARGAESERQLHTFLVPSGLCLLSTRPNIEGMRRSLVEYWIARGEGLARAHTERTGDDSEAVVLVEDGVSELGLDDTVQASGASGPWTGLTTDDLRKDLMPFVAMDSRRRPRPASPTGLTAETPAGGEDMPTDTSIPHLLSQKSDPDGNFNPAAAAAAASGTARDSSDAVGCVGASASLSSPGFAGGVSSSGLDFDPSMVFRCLSPRHLCLAMTALLCERKVVMVSSRLTLLTMAGEVFRSLLQPLSWSHVYVPLVPRRMAGDLLQCPTPFLLGLDAATAAGLELPRDAVQVHLDTDCVYAPKEFVGSAPTSLLRARLAAVYNPGVDELDHPLMYWDGDAAARQPWGPLTADRIRSVFRDFVSELLQGAAECTFEVGQGSTLTVLLDERLYKRAKNAAAKATERYYQERRFLTAGRVARNGPLYNRQCGVLLDQFVKTQMLSHYLSEGTWL